MSGLLEADANALRALREGVGWASLDHIQVVRLGGEGAFALLDRVSTAPLYVREGEMRSSLFLAEDGSIFADVTLARENGGYTLFVEGPTSEELVAYLERARPIADAESPPATIELLAESHALVCLTGPFAWELASALLGPGVIGMPYLSVLEAGGVTCYRAGKTGEYAYDLLIPREQLPAWRDRIASQGQAFALESLSRDVLGLAALENWQFDPRPVIARAARAAGAAMPLTPLELQLQWRVGSQRSFVGADALRAHKASVQTGGQSATNAALRATAFVAEGTELEAGAAVRAGDTVTWEGVAVGEILDAAWSPTRAAWVGIALLPVARAHPWLAGYAAVRPTADSGDGGAASVPLRTVTPPLLDNRSLYVDPHRATYATRSAITFPPLVRG